MSEVEARLHDDSAIQANADPRIAFVMLRNRVLHSCQAAQFSSSDQAALFT